MQIITTTQLRTNTKQLTQSLNRGETIKLIHHSKIIGNITPLVYSPISDSKKTKVLFSKAIKNAQKIFSETSKFLPKNNEDLMKNYYNLLLKKHGKNIS